MDIILEVLKWIIVLLIAGFIGQFGKSLSLHVIDYYRKKKGNRTPPAPSMTKEAEKEDIRVVREGDATPKKGIIVGAKEQNPKAVKKALKAQLKAKKKAEN